jgi:hypothetical protein
VGHITKRTPWTALFLTVLGFLVIISLWKQLLPLMFDTFFTYIEYGVVPGTEQLMDIFNSFFLMALIGFMAISIAFVYILHWYFKTGKELAEELGEGYRSGLWMFFGLILGFPMLYVNYKIANMASDYTKTGGFYKYLLLLLFLGPIGIFVVQYDINKKTPFGALEEGPPYDIFTRFGYSCMEHWWLLIVIVIYAVLFIVWI